MEIEFLLCNSNERYNVNIRWEYVDEMARAFNKTKKHTHTIHKIIVKGDLTHGIYGMCMCVCVWCAYLTVMQTVQRNTVYTLD